MDSTHSATQWAQLPAESSEASQAFKAYRDMGCERSLHGGYRASAGRAAGTRAPKRWRIWSKGFDWKARVTAWDARTDLVELTARQKVIEEDAAADQLRKQQLREREDTFLAAARERVLQMLRTPLFRKEVVHEDGRTITNYPDEMNLQHRDRDGAGGHEHRAGPRQDADDGDAGECAGEVCAG